MTWLFRAALCLVTVAMCVTCGAYAELKVERLAHVCAKRPRFVGAATRLSRLLRGAHPLRNVPPTPSWQLS